MTTSSATPTMTTRLIAATLLSLPVGLQLYATKPNRLQSLQSTQVTTSLHARKLNEDYAQFTQTLAQKPPQNANELVLAATNTFLNRPFAYDYNGDGPGADFKSQAYDDSSHVDCMSLATMVLSMLVSPTSQALPTTLEHVRYQSGKVGYFSRHHFTSLWNKANEEQGFLYDLTKNIKYADSTAAWHKLDMQLNLPAWMHFQKKLLSKQQPLTAKQQQLWQQYYNQSKKTSIDLSYIPVTELLPSAKSSQHLLQQIPGGSLVYFVTPHWDLRKLIGTEVEIMHIGFLVRKNGQLYLRHAAFKKHVLDVPFADYLEHAHQHLPQIKGVHIAGINSPHLPLQH